MLKKIKKIALIFSITLLASFLIIQLLIFNESHSVNITELQTQEFDYIIVLGAAVWGSEPSPALYNRLVTTYQFAKDNNVKIIVCGGLGAGNTITEAAAMKSFLINKNINAARIFKEEHSTSTFENFKYARDKIAPAAGIDNPRILIISSDFHLFRAKFLAQRLGFEVAGLPAETPPNTKISMFFREYFAVIKSFLFDH
ncbi:MAG: YdcF family protein [Desulfotomaculum sp.]|nr:YdcF family protein [Desulfotomaculum sp.]